MNKYPEDPSLLEVKEWKEQCRQENSQLTQAEYLEKLQKTAQTMSTEYHLNLPTQKRQRQRTQQLATLHSVPRRTT